MIRCFNNQLARLYLYIMNMIHAYSKKQMFRHTFR